MDRILLKKQHQLYQTNTNSITYIMEQLKRFIATENIGEALQSIRSEKGLSKQNFAQLADISQSYYSEIIHGKKKPNIETLE